MIVLLRIPKSIDLKMSCSKKNKYTLNKMPSIWSWFALKHANKLFIMMKCLASLINCCSSGGSPSIYLPIHDLLYIFGRFDLIVSSPAFLAQFLRHRVTLPTGAEMSSSDYVVNYLLCYMRSASNTIRYWGFWRTDRIKKQIFICSSFFSRPGDGRNEWSGKLHSRIFNKSSDFKSRESCEDCWIVDK